MSTLAGRPPRLALGGRRHPARCGHRRDHDARRLAAGKSARIGRAHHRRAGGGHGAGSLPGPHRRHSVRRHRARRAAAQGFARQRLPARGDRERARRGRSAWTRSARCESWRCVLWRVGSVAAKRPPRLEPQDVVVAAGPSPQAESLVRRGVTTGPAHRRAVHGDHRRTPPRRRIESRRARRVVQATAEQVGATFTERPGGDVAREIRETVREVVAQHLVIGASDRPAAAAGASHLTHRSAHRDPPRRGRARHREAAAGRRREADRHRGGRRTVRAQGHACACTWGTLSGCGTTTAMLDEARRRASRGTDCVVAAIVHPHPGVDSALADLEIIGGGPPAPRSSLTSTQCSPATRRWCASTISPPRHPPARGWARTSNAFSTPASP